MMRWFRKPGLAWMIIGLLFSVSGQLLVLRNQNMGR